MTATVTQSAINCTIERGVLVEALKIVGRATKGKSTATTGLVKLAQEADRLVLSTTNLEQAITVKLPVPPTDHDKAPVVVDFDPLLSIDTFTSETVTLRAAAGDERLTVTGGRTVSRVKAHPNMPRLWPVMPDAAGITADGDGVV